MKITTVKQQQQKWKTLEFPHSKTAIKYGLIIIGFILTIFNSLSCTPCAYWYTDDEYNNKLSTVVDKKKAYIRQTDNKDVRRSRIANLLIAGTQKAGTSALYAYLANFTQYVCGPTARPGLSYTGKEAHFFDEKEQLELGLSQYESLFHSNNENGRCTDKHKIAIDATPNYMAYPEEVYKIYKEHGTADSVKILFTLREPVRRELSWYEHLYREMTVPEEPPEYARVVERPDGTIKDFQEHIETYIMPQLNHPDHEHLSTYAYWLERWFQLFDRKQIMVTSYDDLKQNETDFLLRLHDFLEFPINNDELVTIPQSNHEHVEIQVTPTCESQNFLAKIFDPYNEQLYKLLAKYPGPDSENTPFTKFNYRCKERQYQNETLLTAINNDNDKNVTKNKK